MINKNFKIKFNKLNIKKKGVTPIIALSLILVVAVVATLSFTGWFTGLSTGILTNSNSPTSQYSKLIDLKLVTQNSSILTLYYQNKNKKSVNIDSISINENYCTLNSTNTLEKNSITQIKVSNCSVNSINQVNVILYTDSEIVESSKLVD